MTRQAIELLRKAGAWRYRWIWAAAIPLAVWAMVRGFGLDGGSLLVPVMAFTPYAAVAALLVAGVAAALRNWAAVALAALATACLAVAVLPRAFGSGEDSPPGATRLDVLSANVYLGTAEPRDLLALVRAQKPDLLAVQELAPAFADALRRVGIDRFLPHSILTAHPGAIGRGVYSRLPLRRLPESSFSNPRFEVELPGGQMVRIVNVHPHTPIPGRIDRWQEALERLPATGSGDPWLLLGDFNATLDQAVLRDVLDRGYRDAGEATGEGLEPTWPAEKMLPPLVTIDHVLADRRLGIASYGVDDLAGSDHRPIHASLFLR